MGLLIPINIMNSESQQVVKYKKKIALYCVILLVLLVFLGLFQAKGINKSNLISTQNSENQSVLFRK